ncbi:MAG: BRO family protein [Bacilli bacterium]|nr:BRO family protein [Bacilli bacterium]
MNEIKEYTEKMFENIKHIDENGNEYWYARELMPLLEYSKWERFANAINNAKTSCIKSGYDINDHFPEVGKMVQIGSKTSRKLVDYKLSRYACYLIVQNGDSRKKAIALGQTYFAIQTRNLV